MTEQQHKKAVDINTIVARANKSRVLPMRTDRPMYGDFTNAVDFHVAQNRILAAVEDFNRLSSEIRERFDNSPAKLIEFVNNPDNVEEARTLGLLPERKDKGSEADRPENVPQAKPEGPETTTEINSEK